MESGERCSRAGGRMHASRKEQVGWAELSPTGSKASCWGLWCDMKHLDSAPAKYSSWNRVSQVLKLDSQVQLWQHFPFLFLLLLMSCCWLPSVFRLLQQSFWCHSSPVQWAALDCTAHGSQQLWNVISGGKDNRKILLRGWRGNWPAWMNETLEVWRWNILLQIPLLYSTSKKHTALRE